MIGTESALNKLLKSRPESDDDAMEDVAEQDGRASPYLVERLIALWNLVDDQGTLLVPNSPLTKDRCPMLYKAFVQQL
jgi:hypothetical protein